MPDEVTDEQVAAIVPAATTFDPKAASISINALAEAATVDLMAWRAKHILNSPFSRNTNAYNRIQHGLTEIIAALGSVKE